MNINHELLQTSKLQDENLMHKLLNVCELPTEDVLPELV